VRATLDPIGQAQQSEALETPFLETPFLDVPEAAWAVEARSTGEAPFLPETPFLSEYLVGDEAVRPEQVAFGELLAELYDTEFDEAVAELAAEAETYVDQLGLGETEPDQARAERLLEAWIEPLRMETEAMLVGLAEALEAEDPMAMSEAELDTLIDRFEPSETEHGPVFEGFLKNFLKKARKVAQGAVKAAKAGIAAVSKIMPIGIILRKLAVLVRPLLTRVLKFALNKLPVEYREPAKLVARKLFGIAVSESLDEAEEEDLEWSESEMEEEALEADEQPATADVRQIQEAFDTEAASLLFAPSEQEQDLFLAEAGAASSRTSASSLADLDAARERFVDGMARLDEAADPTPLVQNFLPAILPALRLGLKIAGRPRVVQFLAQYLGRLISPYVGPSVSPGLSRAIVDAGLRLMTLETELDEGEAPPALAAEAFAALVEDTVTRVAQLDEEELADETLLEEATYTAFHESAAANFPAPVLSEENEYLESARAGGTWVAMPRRGPRRYRKYSRVFDVVIHPAAARAIRTFGGRPLGAFIRDGLGRSGPVRARVHLYQATPGTSLARIARSERGVPGLGSADRRARARLHPLTPMAAAALVGEPALGREVSEAYADGSGPLAIGQRLYYLEVPGSTVAPVAAGADAGSPRKSSDASAVIDAASGELKVTLYLSEADSQTIAARLRKREPLGASLAVLRRVYGPAIGSALGSGRGGRVQIKSEEADEVDTEDLVRRPMRSMAMRPRLAMRRAQAMRGRASGLRRRPGRFRRRVLVRWIGSALARELDRMRDAFLQAIDAPEDGVSIVLRLRPPGLRVLVGAGVPRRAVAGGPGPAQVEITPGPPRG
jgi:hypothetical protein